VEKTDERKGEKVETAGCNSKEKAEVNVNQRPIVMQHNVAVVPVFEKQQVTNLSCRVVSCGCVWACVWVFGVKGG
jgi:hypothetical protein